MSDPANQELMDSLPDGIGTLSPPALIDKRDEPVARAMTEPADNSAQSRTGAASQQGQVAADVETAKSRINRAMAREADTDARINAKVKRFLKNEADGFLQVIRLGPVEMPSIELGVVCQIRHAQLEAMTMAQCLLGMVGGGLFQICAYRGDNTPVEGDVYTVQVVGDPKPKTETGRNWLARSQREGSLSEPFVAPRSEDDGGKSMTQILMQMMERDKERDRLRADADAARRREEADERKREWEAKAAEDKHRRELEIAELKAQRAREQEEAKTAREREREDAKTLREQENALFKQRMEAQLKQMELDSAARLKKMELDDAVERDRRKMLLDNESRQLETRQTGGLGFEGLTVIREQIAGAMAKQLIKGAGLEEEEESGGIGGAIAETLRAEGPELVRKMADVFLPRIAAWLPGGSPPQVVHAQPQTLPPPQRSAAPSFSTPPQQLPEPEHVEPESDIPTEPADAPAPPGVPTQGIVATAATNHALTSVLRFIRPATVIALNQPDAESAWDEEVGPNGQTLSDFYRLMPRGAREAASADWSKFLGAVREASAADAQMWDKAMSEPGGEAWRDEWLSKGPWVPESVE